MCIYIFMHYNFYFINQGLMRRETENHMKEKQQLLQREIQIRQMPEGEYWEYITKDYQLTLEYYDGSLLIALDTVKGKNFRKKVSHEGQHYSNNFLHAIDIFEAFKQDPQIFSVDEQQGILMLEIKEVLGKKERTQKKEIKMKQEKLDQATLLRINFNRTVRKLRLEKMKLQEQNHNYLEVLDKQNKQIDELRKEVADFKENNSKGVKVVKVVKMVKVVKAIHDINKYPESLIDKTSLNRKQFEVSHNHLTKKGEGEEEKMILLNVVGEGLLSLMTHIQHTRYGRISLGVIDRMTQKERKQPEKHQSVFLYGWSGRIFHATGQGNWTSESPHDCLRSGMDVLMEVDRINCVVTFTLQGQSSHYYTNEPIQGRRQYRVHSPILNQAGRHFVPFYSMCDSEDSISWQLP